MTVNTTIIMDSCQAPDHTRCALQAPTLSIFPGEHPPGFPNCLDKRTPYIILLILSASADSTHTTIASLPVMESLCEFLSRCCLLRCLVHFKINLMKLFPIILRLKGFWSLMPLSMLTVACLVQLCKTSICVWLSICVGVFVQG